jgi:hypothetical protein
MMKKTIKISIWIFVLALGHSCTDLDEELYDTIAADNFYKNEQECLLAMGNAYTTMQFRGTNLWGLFGATVVSTDEAVVPFRTEGVFLRNNGIFLRTHRHDFLPTIPQVFAPWEFSFNTIGACNQVIFQIENSPSEFEAKPKMIAELKVLRAFTYYVALDLYGNIPITLDFEETQLPEQVSRSEAFNIIENEVLQNMDLLDEMPATENYGRCIKPVAEMILAKMYLNAEKWTGTARWDDAIIMLDRIINSGAYTLESNYFDNFTIQNENSSEAIFNLPYDRRQGWGWQLHSYTLHPSFSSVYNYSAPIWNGMSSTQEFYEKYDSDDLRINSWLVGPQTTPGGQPLMSSRGEQIVFTPEIDGLETAGETQGVRCAKWEFTRDLQRNESMDNDWVFFRYADVLLMKAEALMRKNGGVATTEAVDLVNQVRERAYGNSSHNYTTATLTMDELLDERGRELAWEGHRRQDLIRFGKWENEWFGKPASSSDHTELMPIPSREIAANPKLQQNPGY